MMIRPNAGKPLLAVIAAISSSFPLCAGAQTALPAVTVTDSAKAKPRPVKKPAHAAKPGSIKTAGAAPANPGAVALPGTTAVSAPTAAQSAENAAHDQREQILPKTGANTYTLTKSAIDTLPQGDNTTIDRVLLQAPGISQDSAASGDLHIRNEHANLQYRINGILLPDGVSGFSQVIDTSLIKSLAVIDGALPAQYGLHTAGLIDIQTRDGADQPGGTVGIYGGSHGTITPTLTYSGTAGRWDYFVTGRYLTNNLGIENPTSSVEAIHDRTRQGDYFAYVSGLLEDNSRVTFMSGASVSAYQIPNSPGQPPQFTAFGVSNFDSSLINENQVERSIFNILAWQKNFGPLDSQVSYFQRYSSLHFVPDLIGDLVFNGVASDVTRTSLVNGVQGDNSYRVDARDTLRFGFTADVEHATAINNSVVLPLDNLGNPIDAPFLIGDSEGKTGEVAGFYVQNEYKLTPQLTVNGGLRFDTMQEYVSASQLSPRLGLVYKPFEDTTFHIGYARYFTPPELALSAPTPLQTYANTTLAPGVNQDSPVRPERSHFFDAGVTQRVLPGLDAGVDVYYKIATNLIDDGQFGQALVLTAFNYARAYNDGVEFKLNYVHDGFHAYGNLAIAQQRATQVSSNQYLFSPAEIAYIANNYIYTDHDQLITASGGVSYDFHGTKVSLDGIYGSGLRNGFANTGTVAPYATANLGVTRDFVLTPDGKPLTVRFTVVNLTDAVYEIRDGSGIGVFAPQYGQRRGFFAGVSQRF
jgi:outer membrane receptor protein involved in Fe transport